MDQETVLALRESRRISSFLREMDDSGRITPFERRLVIEEASEVHRRAGYLDLDDVPADVAMGAEKLGVVRQANHAQRSKILELHPELGAELEQAIAKRLDVADPARPHTPGQPGAALAGYLALLDFIDRKRDGGQISRDEAYAAFDPAVTLFEDAGIDMDHLTAATDPIVLRKAEHAVREKLLALRPELAGEVRNLGSSRGR